MGYQTYVTAKLVIKESERAAVMLDLENARQKIKAYEEWSRKRWSKTLSTEEIEKAKAEAKQYEPSYFDWHKAECKFEDGVLDCNPSEEALKWYGMGDFIDWLIGKVDSGEFWWSGEEDDDHGGYRWIDGKMEKGEYELQWRPYGEDVVNG